MAATVLSDLSERPAYNASPVTDVRLRGDQLVPAGAGIILVVAVMILAGWTFHIPALFQPVPGSATMKATTAVGFIGIALSILLQARRQLPRLAVALGLFVAVLGVLSLGHVAFGPEFVIDQFWLSEGDPLHRMSPITAFDFSVIGLALACSVSARRAWIAQTFTLVAMLVAAIVAIGYFYRVSNLVGIGAYTSVAPHTAALLLISCACILFLQPTAGVMAVFVSDTLGGRMARRVMPFTIAVPILLGWLRLWGERMGLYDPRVGPPLVIVGTMILLSIVVWRNARTIAKVDAKRQRTEDDLRRANESLEGRVEEKTAELVESRARAAESAEMFFQLFEFAPDALVAVAADGRIDRTNIRAMELFGYEQGELIGQPVELLIPERHMAAHIEHRDGFMKNPHPKAMGPRLDLSAKRKNGTEFPVDIVLSPADSPRGPLVLAVIRDITERRRAEALTRAAEERLRTGQRMEALGQLAGGVAHDFNNMMTVVSGYSELLLAHAVEADPFRKGLLEIKKAGDRCANLTSHLLAFSRRQVLSASMLDLGAIVRDLGEMMPILLGEHIVVTLAIEPGVWAVRADRAQIEQVIVNLIVNARDAMPNGGKLTLRVSNVNDTPDDAMHPDISSGPYVMVSVRDTGHGMDDDTRARVFDPFFTTKPVGQGSGLGLSTAYGFIKQSGGYIQVDSAPNQGTTVEVYLPRAVGEIDDVPATGLRAGPGGHETILIAEDETAVRALLREVLGRAGYRLLEADSGPQALEVAAAHDGPIHLLLADVVMPVMSGSELAEWLAPTRPDLRVLLVSGYAQGQSADEARRTSGFAFLRKPFTPAELLGRIRHLLDA
jgi:two-component system cell cycle sensor histidine kinase/response regulator CckA